MERPLPDLGRLLAALSSYSLADLIALALTAVVTVVGLYRGRGPERLFVIGNTLVLYAKSVVIMEYARQTLAAQILAMIDVSFLVVCLPIALYSNRYWPMVAAVLLAMIVMLDVVGVISAWPITNAKVTSVVWLYAIQTTVLLGVLLEGRRPTRTIAPRPTDIPQSSLR